MVGWGGDCPIGGSVEKWQFCGACFRDLRSEEEEEEDEMSWANKTADKDFPSRHHANLNEAVDCRLPQRTKSRS